MSNVDLSRRTDVEIKINGTTVTADLKEYLLSLSYTDEEEDKTDDLSITIDDREGIWLKSWLNTNKNSGGGVSKGGSESSKFNVGDRVMVKRGALFEGGITPLPFVYTYEDFTVIQVGSKGEPDRIVFGINGIVTGAMDASDLYKLGEDSVSGVAETSGCLDNSSCSETFVVGDRVRVKRGARYDNGVVPFDWVYDYEFTVLEIGRLNPRRIVFGIGQEITGAMDVSDLYKSAGNSENGASSGGATSNGLMGATISASIIRRNFFSDGKDMVLNCGEFNIDTIQISGPPSKISIKATSLANSSTVRAVKKNRAWEKISLKEIAESIAKQNGLSCFFSGDYDPIYDRKEQLDESDIVFLQSLCKASGISLKVTSGTIILFDESEYEKKAPVRVFEFGKSDIKSYTLSDGTSDATYSSCHVSYTDSKTGKTIEYTYTPRKDNPGTGEILEVNEKVSDREEARKLAMKRLRQKNKNRFAVSLKTVGDPLCVAGNTATLKGFGDFDGTYIISQAVHSISNGYTTSVKMRRCLEEY